jgi:hypothetical protein
MEWKFLPFMCRLRFFEFHAYLVHDFNISSFAMASLRISLTSPATLEHIKFNILCVFRASVDWHNFNFNTFYESLRHADVWRHLDSITTHPTGSRLRRVDINISYAVRCEEPDEDKIKKAVLDGLPLLHKKGILFVEAVLKK